MDKLIMLQEASNKEELDNKTKCCHNLTCKTIEDTISYDNKAFLNYMNCFDNLLIGI